ncbi:CSN-associated deubiquitinating enzyme Ubp12, partial [Ceratobasidium sp. 423]
NAKSKAVTAPSAMSTLKSTFTSTFRGKSPAPVVQRGTMGLQNLNNTCFMSSALQCLTHAPELEEYFLSGLYKHEPNYNNPLGMPGQIANVFGALLHHLYPFPNAAPEPEPNFLKPTGRLNTSPEHHRISQHPANGLEELGSWA